MPLPSRRSAPEPERNLQRFLTLAVCTGNVCRSPQLAPLLGERLRAAFKAEGGSSLAFESAGVLAREGAAFEPNAAREAARIGIAPDAIEMHRSRRLRPRTIEEADLILCLDAGHRSSVVSSAPSALRRTFTLLEFAAVLEHLTRGAGYVTAASVAPLDARGLPTFLRGVVHAAARARGVVGSGGLMLDVEDPMGRSDEVFHDSADAIAAAVERIVASLKVLAWNR